MKVVCEHKITGVCNHPLCYHTMEHDKIVECNSCPCSKVNGSANCYNVRKFKLKRLEKIV